MEVIETFEGENKPENGSFPALSGVIGVSGDLSLSQIEFSLFRIESIISLSADRTIFSKNDRF